MKKIEQNFTAIQIVTRLAGLLDGSGYELFRMYNPDLKESSIGIDDMDPFSYKKNNNNNKTAIIAKIADEDMQQLRAEVDYLQGFLKATPEETLLLVAIYTIQLNSNSSVDTRDICRYLNIGGLDFLPLKNSVQSLLTKRLIRRSNRRRNDDYLVTDMVEQAILKNKPLKRMKPQETSRFQFCEIVSNLIDTRRDDDVDTIELFSLVETEEKNNTHLGFIKELKKIMPGIEDRVLFYEICDDFLREREHKTGLECTVRDIYDNLHRGFGIARSIMNKKHPIIEKDLVELLPAKFLSEAELQLTDKGKRVLLEEDYELFCGRSGNDKRLQSPDKIPARELFFSDAHNFDETIDDLD